MQDPNLDTLSIIHITGVGKLYPSIRSQLCFEFLAKSQVKTVKWDVAVFHYSEAIEPFEHQIPPPFRLIILRNLYIWWQVWKLSSKYDLVMLRYMSFDPFGFIFATFIHNIISIHHSKEIEELVLIRKDCRGKAASALEFTLGRLYLCNVLGIVGVTKEIALHETQRISNCVPYSVYPNGISLNAQSILPDNRHSQNIKLVFACSYFSEWHGLDLLLDRIEDYPLKNLTYTFQILLMGTLSSTDRLRINNSQALSSVLQICGYLSGAQYESFLASCDAGIASLALHRKNLHEASTLKVRQYLAMGLPVFSNHFDSSFPKNFPFYINFDLPCLDNVLNTCQSLKTVSRNKIRDNSFPYISKASQMQRLEPWLHEFVNSPSKRS